MKAGAALLLVLCGACGGTPWTAADENATAAHARAELLLQRYCATDDGGLCTPAFVRSVTRGAACDDLATLHRHRVDVDGGPECR
jgi:hypothetical protein